MIKRCECGHGKSYHRYIKHYDFNVCEGAGYVDWGIANYDNANCPCNIGFAEDPSRIGVPQLWTKIKISPTNMSTRMEIRGNKNNPFMCERDYDLIWHDTYDKDEPDFAHNNGYCIFDPELWNNPNNPHLAVDDKRCWDHIADPTIKYCKGGCGLDIHSKSGKDYCMGCLVVVHD